MGDLQTRPSRNAGRVAKSHLRMQLQSEKIASAEDVNAMQRYLVQALSDAMNQQLHPQTLKNIPNFGSERKYLVQSNTVWLSQS